LQPFGLTAMPGALFYATPCALRFELGGGVLDVSDARIPRFLQAMDRAREITRALFPTGAPVVLLGLPADARARRLRSALKQAQIDLSWFEPIDDDLPTITFRRRWFRAEDVAPGDLEKLLWCVNGAEIGICPAARDIGVYFLLPNGSAMLHVYDDRGADMIGAWTRLKPLFDRFSDWLLDYDLPRMRETFAAPS
jgi:hypothetical protein